MASPPMDALASFVYLTEHLPTWITKVNTLAAHVVTKAEEFSAEYKRVLEQARPKRRKTPSVTSLHPNDGQASIKSQGNTTNAELTASVPRPSDISPLDPANRYLFANARRGKRRQGTSLRSGASGPQTFRNQHQAIIYYDSTIQNGLQALVKDVATARNNLRKGKQAMALERGLQLPPLEVGKHGPKAQNPILTSLSKSYSPIDNAMKPKILINELPPDDEAPFTEISKDLEAAQALCETAAHQFLRDGDCTLEMNRIRAYFENVLEVARAQVEVRKLEKNDSGKDVKNTETVTAEGNLAVAAAVMENLGLKFNPIVNTHATEIEVDSDDDCSEHGVVELSQFRGARTTGLRA